MLIVPDFIAKAGGVICAAVEYRGSTETQAFEEIAQKVRRNTGEVLKRSQKEGITPREADVTLARKPVREAMTFRA